MGAQAARPSLHVRTQVSAQRFVLRGTGLLQLQAAMPTFLEEHNAGLETVRQLTGNLQAALAQQALALLPSYNESIMVRAARLSLPQFLLILVPGCSGEGG